MKTSPDKHHHFHIKNPLKSDSGSDSESHSTGSHTGLSRLFRHSSNHNLKENSGAYNASNPPSGSVSRTGSFLSLKRHNSNPNNRARSNSEHHHHHLLNLIPGHNSGSSANLSQSAPKEGKKLTKAETVAYLQSVNNKNAARAQYRPPAAPPGSGSGSGSGSGGGVGSHEKMVYNPYGVNKNASQQSPKNSSFYMSGTDDGERVLANPVADPNDYLPEEYHQEHINLLDDYEIDVGTKKLGDGGSSDVRIINALNHKKEYYALKKFTLLSKETDQEFYERVAKEFIISRKCSTSRHVADVLALVRIQSQANLTRGWGFVMEWCSGGDLFNTIVKPGWKRTPLNEKYCVFKQICYGLKAIHELDIVHRDLKPENVLLDANGCVKLCDFGVSNYGHETPGDFTSPLKTSHAYVGSPPYSPPEVMLLKEKSPTEAKHFQYDPFKMDYWGLGMLLFCIVYGGVPFQMSSVNDHAYRDYKFNHDRYCSDHPHFKNNHDYAKGPGSEFKWASQFQSTGASRVAWKLCDPSVARRYDLDLLFNDPWFQGLEMCVYEHPDQTVNPFVLPGTGLNNQKPSSVIHSNTGSLSNSVNPSRRGTVNHENGESDSEGITTPFRSMLDLVGGGSKPQDHQEDTSSIHSASSLSHHPLNLKRDEKERVESNGSSSGGEEHKFKSMLDTALDPGKENLPKDNLPAVEESSVEHEAEEEEMKEEETKEDETKEEEKKQPESHEQLPQSSSSCFNKTRSSSPTNKKPLPSLSNKLLRSSSDLKLEEDGTCELGYKIKKHHHSQTSSVPVSRMR